MRKINISNDSKRDAEVAFGNTLHRHQPVYKLCVGVQTLQLFCESLDVTLFEIQLTGIALGYHIPLQEFLPVLLFLKDQPVRKDHVPVKVNEHLKSEQIMIELL